MTRLVNYIQPVHLEAFAEIIDWLTEDDDPDAQKKMDFEGLKWWQNSQAFSGIIKEGVYQGVTLLSIVQGRFSKSTEWVDNLVTAKLKEFDIDRYLSNRHNLKWLAESSPSSFLNYIQSDIKAGAPLLNKIFEVKHKQFSIVSSEIYYTELLFCLESLAWDLKYLFRVTDILLFLCKYPNDSNYSNRPDNSLAEIYRFRLPQTYASFAERLSILKSLGEKYPEQVYKLSFRLLKNISQEVFGCTSHFRWRLREYVKIPKYIETIPYIHVNELTELMLSLCAFDEQSICDLLELSSNKFMNCARNIIFKTINIHIDFIKCNETVTNILRKDINRHLSCMGAGWALSEEELTPYQELLATIEPQDILKKNRHFFDDILICESDINDFDEDYQKNIKASLNKRVSILNSIIKEKGINAVWELASIVGYPDCVADTLIEINGNEHRIIVYQKYIEGVLNLKFVRHYFSTLYFKEGREKYISYVDELSKINEERLAVILYVPELRMEFADRAALISPQVEDEYWRNVNVWGYNKDDIKKIIVNLSRFDRNADVLRILSNSDCSELVSAKEKIVIISDMLHEGHVTVLIHNAPKVAKILKTIELPTDTNERNLLLQCEFIMYDHLRCYFRKEELHFTKVLNEDPELMMQLIQMSYLPDEDTDEQLPTDENEKNLRMMYAHLTHNFFFHYHGVPCTKEDGSIDEPALWEYISQLQQLAISYHRIRVMLLVIGHILGNIPETDNYPTDGLCKMVELLNDDTVDTEISCALCNRRGSTVRAYNAGGDIERGHIDTFRKYRDRTILRSPRLTKIFEDKMKEYEIMAEQEDESAKLLDLKN